MYGTLIEQKKRYIAAMELTVQELLLFTEEPLEPEKIDEGKVAYTNRLNKISAAKKKAIDNISEIQAKIKEENDIIKELEGGPVATPGSPKEEQKEKDVSIRTPENRN